MIIKNGVQRAYKRHITHTGMYADKGVFQAPTKKHTTTSFTARMKRHIGREGDTQEIRHAGHCNRPVRNKDVSGYIYPEASF